MRNFKSFHPRDYDISENVCTITITCVILDPLSNSIQMSGQNEDIRFPNFYARTAHVIFLDVDQD